MIEGMQRLDPRQLILLRVRAAVFGAVLLALGIVADIFWTSPLPAGTASAAALLIALAAFAVLPGRRYRAWGWRMDEDELRIASGLMIRSEGIVPFGRVQHIDVVRGPLQRSLGLASLILHTAGTRSAAVLLPGLDPQEAERIRDHVRAKIREDLV